MDVVLLVESDKIPELVRQAAALGIVPRITDPEGFAHRNRVLLLRHSLSGINIDISLGVLPFEEEMVKRSQPFALSGLRLRLPTPEDLIILKAVAHRPKDLLDIEALLTNQTFLDKEYIRTWVKQFADALEMPELWDDLPAHLKQPGPRQTTKT